MPRLYELLSDSATNLPQKVLSSPFPMSGTSLDELLSSVEGAAGVSTQPLMADDAKIDTVWSDQELDLIVADYFAILVKELARARLFGLNVART